MGSQVTSKHLQGITELTLVADVTPGLIKSLDTCTYETRLALVMRTLSGLRSSSREHSPIRPFSDTVERIQEIHSFRLAVIQPKPGEGVTKRLMLAVGFDGGWEQYIRRIWRDLGPLLDVMFCNTTDYKISVDTSFRDYVAWIRSKQVEAGFFYNASGLTVTDLQYLRQLERKQREGASDLDLAKETAVSPKSQAADAAKLDQAETIKLGLTALTALYRLTDYYPPDGDDGVYLLRASRALLEDFDTSLVPPDLEKAYRTQLDWIKQDPPKAPRAPQWPVFEAKNVQGGILGNYEQDKKQVNHGCLLLMQVTKADGADPHAFLGELRKQISSHVSAPGDGIYVTVAFTSQGLERLGVPTAALEQFPKEFREGMEARADLLGDFRCNHPRNWALPRLNWPTENQDSIKRVQLSLVDIVVQLRALGKPFDAERDHEIIGNTEHPLSDKVSELAKLAGDRGVRLLSVEAMVTYRDGGKPVGHLGFVDGISQPKVQDQSTGEKWNDAVKRGEILCGHENDSKDAPLSGAAAEYLNDGTFLVVRKLRLDIAALNAFFKKAGEDGIASRAVLGAKMMGRKPDGNSLTEPPTDGNNFNYDGPENKTGALCPFQSHARRANPRTGAEKPKVPRIMRRGMSYGPKGKDDAECGLMFLAYNASIAEQFEVIQRWIAGGNSSGAYSGDPDPFLGVPQLGDKRTFRFQDDGEVKRVDLDAGQPSPGARPFARLDWGAYLFVPSLPVLDKLAAPMPAVASDAAEQGAVIVKTLLALESKFPVEVMRDAWKGYLEDLGSKEMKYNDAIWAAIREKFGGALWTPYGVLVASGAMVDFVFTNKDLYSVEGYAPHGAEGYLHRSRNSIGEIYLGLDDKGPDSEYVRQSKEVNEKLMELEGEDAFNLARKFTRDALSKLVGNPRKEVAVDLRTRLVDPVLADLCLKWFDLPDGRRVANGGWNWQAGHQPCCPGDFTSPSRYIFQPNPGKTVIDYAEKQGQALHTAVKAFVADMRGGNLQGEISKALFELIPKDDARLASTLIGVMMGFLPTVDGNFRLAMHRWLTDGSLWRMQADLEVAPGGTEYEKARAALLAPLMVAMQKRPVPDIVWRTAKVKHDLGPVSVQAGDKLAIGIVSATQESLLAGKPLDVMPVFGGTRGPKGPTHACPAYAAGMGVLLGMVSGLLGAGTIKPSPLPVTVLLS